METLLDLWHTTTPYHQRALAVVVGLSVYVVVDGVRAALFKRLHRVQETGRFAMALAVVSSTSRLLILALAIYAATNTAALNASVMRWLDRAIVILVGLQVGLWGTAIATQVIQNSLETSAAASRGVFRLISVVVRVAIWSAVLLFVLDNLGVNVTALVAGLGVGGIAIGLALQNVLGDLFASLSIVLDKPFVVDDFVVFDDIAGTIESIGLKTTRIRSLSGELIICGNGQLLGSRIRNFKQMAERRIVMKIGIVYDTPPEKVERALAIIKEVVSQQKKARLDRSHFQALGAYSLDFETVYWVESPDYNIYMDIQQAINFTLYRRFADEGLSFAFPTQTIYSIPAGPAPER